MTRPSRPTLLISWTIVSLLLAATAVAGDGGNFRVQFVQETSCPYGDLSAFLTGGSVRELSGVLNQRTCLVECSLWQQCVAVFYSVARAVCQLGVLNAWMQCWQLRNTSTADAACISYIRPPPLPDSLQAKLLIFYNFRFDLANQINASTFLVSPSNAKRTRMGLELLGTFESWAEVDLMGRSLKSYLNAQREVAFFIKVSTTFDAEQRCFQEAYNKSIGTGDGVTSRWCRGQENAVFYLARDLSSVGYTSTVGFLPSDMLNQVTYSTAVTLSSASPIKFFYNGVSYGAALNSPVDQSTVLGDTGLILGYDNSAPFKGFIHCYGFANSLMNETDFAQLSNLC